MALPLPSNTEHLRDFRSVQGENIAGHDTNVSLGGGGTQRPSDNRIALRLPFLLPPMTDTKKGVADFALVRGITTTPDEDTKRLRPIWA